MTNKIKLQIHKIGRYEMNTAINIWFLLHHNKKIVDVTETTVEGKMFIEIEFHVNHFEQVAQIINSLIELNLVNTEEN